MKPLVGLLYNPAVPYVIDHAPELVEYVEVIPDRLWYDFGPNERGRFHRVHGAIETLKRCIGGRVAGGHGIGLSLPSAMPLDEAQVEIVQQVAADLDFQWYSEHLSAFLVPHGSIPNAQAGLGLPVAYDLEVLDLLDAKLTALGEALSCDMMMENPAIFAPIADSQMTEPQFFNRLHTDLDCGMLLDLHNLYVSMRNGGPDFADYLLGLDFECVREIHLAGGDELAGFYTDSHSRLSPAEVWQAAWDFAGSFLNLQAIVFEFHESYFDRLGLEGVTSELRRMHELADAIGDSRPARREAARVG
jgi:uncharacterized protein (UPF0276 family)